MSIETVAGKTYWLRGQDLGADGTSITSWADQSDYGRVAVLSNHLNPGAGTVVVDDASTPLGGKSARITAGGLKLQACASVTASSYYLSSATYSPEWVTHPQGSTTRYWHSNTNSGEQWLELDLGAPQVVTSYAVTPYTTSLDTTFNFQAWDGSAWVTLDARTGVTWGSSTKQTFTFSNSTAYQRYRIHSSTTSMFWKVLEFTVGDGALSSGAGELWAVIKSDGPSSGGFWIMGRSTSATHYPYAGQVYDDAGSTTRRSFTPTVAITDWRIYRVRADGTNWRAYLDGVQQATAADTNPSWRDHGFIGQSIGAQQFAGNVAEVIAFDHALSSTDADTVYDYLVAEHFEAPSGITGALNVTDHADTAVLSGTVTAAPVTGALSVTDHADTVTLTGDVAGTTGTLSVVDHADEATLTGTVTAAPITGALAVTDHADLVTLTGAVATTGITGVLSIVDHADEVTLEGIVNGGDTLDNVPFRYGFGVGFLEIPTAIPAPAGIDTVPVVRYSHPAPALSAANPDITQGVDYPWVDAVEVGELHTFVDGIDVTYLGGAPIQSLRRSSKSPQGDVSAEFEIPSMEVWNKAGTGDFWMLRPDAEVEHVLIRPDDARVHLWGGFLSADFSEVVSGRGGSDKGRRSHGFTAEGLLWQAGHTLHQPEHYLPPTDIGTLIPDALNKVPAKRWADVPRVTTGLHSRHRGSGNDTVMKYVNDLLAEYGWTEDGRQWTLVEVAKGEIRLQLKADMTGYDCTVTNGAPGIDVKLSREQSTRMDVIYGKGVTAHGGQWRGTRFPGLVLATPPEYPNTDASSMHLGDTDADTDSGSGISDMQRRLVELGYSLTVDGVLNSNDVDVIRRLQAKMGLLVDGVPGPQTWSGIFNKGPEEIDLSVWREPIAAASWTQPYFRDPNGVILSENPDYDPTRIPHEVEVDFGTNITWQQAQPIAERMLAVEQEPGLTGTIRLKTDPHECWKGEVKPGWRVKVVGFQGEDVIVRVAAVDVDTDDDGMVVTLTVDERARDAMSVAAVLDRNRAVMNDPARRPGNPQRDSRNERDRYVQWDIDSPCGFMPRTALYGGLWVAPNPIPFSEVGQVVRTVMSSTVPFAMMLFGLPVKPSQIQAIVGNPLASTDPYRPHTEALEALGWIEAWGSDGQRLGYWPGDESGGYAFSGLEDLRGAFDYVSGYGVYVWPLFYSASTGFVGGGSGDWVSRFYPGTWA